MFASPLCVSADSNQGHEKERKHINDVETEERGSTVQFTGTITSSEA